MIQVDADGVITDPPFVRSQYNYDRQAASVDTGLECLDPSYTQQQFKEECDINTILERFGVTGHLPMTTKQPMAGDFTDVEDFHGAMEVVRLANENFMTLPSKVRGRFDHDPEKFVDFCVDPANAAAVRELGLARAEESGPQPGQGAAAASGGEGV